MDQNTKTIILTVGLGAVLGGLTGLGLSFTALSPLVIGGIVAAVPAILLVALCVYYDVSKGKSCKEDLFTYAWLCAASAAIGVGLAATAIFPGAMLGAGSAALTGAVTGAIASIAGLFTTEYIIVPIAEEVKECFSSKEKEV